MRKRAFFAACAAAVLAAGLPAPADAAGTRSCGQIGFTPNSDDGIFSIRARGVCGRIVAIVDPPARRA